MSVSPPSPSEPLWSPSRERWEASQVLTYARWLEAVQGVETNGYSDLWQYSVSEPNEFWKGLWSYFQLGEVPEKALVRGKDMSECRWFPDTLVNYAQRLVEGPPGDKRPDPVTVIVRSELGRTEWTRSQLANAVARCRSGLRQLGVVRGDRVVGYLPNGIEALISLLAVASLGAIWSSCPPEFGPQSVLDRFAQLKPRVLLAQVEYQYGGKRYDRRQEIAHLQAKLSSVSSVVLVGEEREHQGPSELSWNLLLASEPDEGFESVPFEHPLWILFSSGTTGLPKPIVHGHGGMLLEHLKVLSFHHDLGEGDSFFWFSTTGWMMWNYLVSGLAVGAKIVLYDGSPAHPDLEALWRLAAEEKVTCFGVSAPFLMACRAAGVKPSECGDLSALRSVGSTGAPLPPEGFEWVYQEVAPDVLLASASGGTDLCTAFVGPCPILPVYSGELQCLALGASVQAWDQEGKALSGAVGELVLTEPMPCMPIGFWNDEEGQRYRESYFEYFPGIWRHGDWIELTDRGSAIISGRSDATLNRGGVRMGTSDFYRVVEEVDWVADSLVVDTSSSAGEGRLWLFLVPCEGEEWGEDRIALLRKTIRKRLSPRHVPDEFLAIVEVPRTTSGKKLEVPVKRALLGEAPESLVNPGALKNPQAFWELLEAAGVCAPPTS